jgi:hypothetical protein
MGSLCHLSMDDYRATCDHPPNEWGEGVQRSRGYARLYSFIWFILTE